MYLISTISGQGSLIKTFLAKDLSIIYYWLKYFFSKNIFSANVYSTQRLIIIYRILQAVPVTREQ